MQAARPKVRDLHIRNRLHCQGAWTAVAQVHIENVDRKRVPNFRKIAQPFVATDRNAAD